MSREAVNEDECYETILEIIKKAGQIIKEKAVLLNKVVKTKTSPTDLSTETDQEVERFIMENISKHFPKHLFIAEETQSYANLSGDPTWIIDPIDGTMNFIHTFPHSCVSVALFVNKQPVIAITYNPHVGQMFSARKGKGAFLNGERISVSGKTKLSEALIMMESIGGHNPEKAKVILQNTDFLMKNSHGIRSLGSAALNMAMVACGAADAYFAFGIFIWDIAAGELLVTEAGGVIMDTAGGKLDRFNNRFLVASSRELAESLSKNIAQFVPK